MLVIITARRIYIISQLGAITMFIHRPVNIECAQLSLKKLYSIRGLGSSNHFLFDKDTQAPIQRKLMLLSYKKTTSKKRHYTRKRR